MLVRLSCSTESWKKKPERKEENGWAGEWISEKAKETHGERETGWKLVVLGVLTEIIMLHISIRLHILLFSSSGNKIS